MSNDPYRDDETNPYDETKKKKKTKDTGVKTLDSLVDKEETEAAKDEVAVATETKKKPAKKKTSLDTYGQKKPPKEPVHIFFDPDVKKILMQEQKKRGRGFKSNYVNDLVRKEFIKDGLLPEE